MRARCAGASAYCARVPCALSGRAHLLAPCAGKACTRWRAYACGRARGVAQDGERLALSPALSAGAPPPVCFSAVAPGCGFDGQSSWLLHEGAASLTHRPMRPLGVLQHSASRSHASSWSFAPRVRCCVFGSFRRPAPDRLWSAGRDYFRGCPCSARLRLHLLLRTARRVSKRALRWTFWASAEQQGFLVASAQLFA